MIRTSWLLGVLARACAATLLAGAAGACSASAPLTVVRSSRDGKPEPVSGDPVKLRRGGQEAYVGIRAGYFVVRSVDDWQRAWPDGKAPPLPATLDTSRQMLLVGVAEDKTTTAVEIKRAEETGGAVHVWVKETRAGEGCPTRVERTPFDAVSAPRIDKPVRVYVDEERAESCGQPPAAEVRCRLAEAATWANDLSASPGDTVECEMTAESRGKFALVDHALTLAELPAGSTSKLSYSKGPSRGTFALDVFGTYRVRAEATDDAGRKTTAVAAIQALPPKTKDVLVEIVWSNFDVSDDPSTFPRLRVQAVDVDAKGARQICASDDPTPLSCDVKARGAYTQLRLPASDRLIPLQITYVDERIEKGPLACVQLWFDGARTAERCDRSHRSADETWSAGVIEMATGKLAEPAAAAAVDAGAGAAPGAGTKKPPTKAPPKKK